MVDDVERQIARDTPNVISRTFDLNSPSFALDYHMWVNAFRKNMAIKHGLMLIGVNQSVEITVLNPHFRTINLMAIVNGVL